MMVMEFSEFIARGGGIYHLIRINSIPVGMERDYTRRNENVRNHRPLCKRCDGTGNELSSMYRKCTVCKGTGVSTN